MSLQGDMEDQSDIVEEEVYDPDAPREITPIHFMGTEADLGSGPGDFRPKPFVEPVEHVFVDDDITDIELDEPRPPETEFPPVMNVPGIAGSDPRDHKVHATDS